MISEVKELQRLNSQEISRLLKENENFLLLQLSENCSTMQVDMDKHVRFLPLHLTAVLLSSQNDEALLRYLLSGLRLLHSFCEIASRHPKLEQILLDDVRVSEQLLDMVFYVLIFCSSCKQGNLFSGVMPLLYAAIVACSIYLLTACISSQWNELAFVLDAHPKVDIFIDVAFGAVRRNIYFIQTNFLADDYTRYSNPSLAVERAVYFHCQQCEASLQFLQQVCQNKSFQGRLLKNKELCGKGGILRLVQAALNLSTPPILKESCAVTAAVSRLKARVLSILLYLCEAESVSYLDEVASIPESLDLVKSVALEVVGLLKTMLSSDLRRPENHSEKTYPRGLLQLNALRLADIFSDDSNLRSYITIYFAEVLAVVLLIPYQQFLSSWCSSDLPLNEEDISLDYEPFTMTGWVLDLSSPSDICNAEICESNFIPIGSPQTSYAHQRTSLLVKVIANLHCFVPNICKEQERNLFLQKFIDHVKIEWQDLQTGDAFPNQPRPGFSFNSAPQNAATVCKNLRSLLGHAESLIPTFLNEEDVQLLRLFFTQVQSLIGPIDLEVNRALEMQIVRDCSSPLHGGTELDLKPANSISREGTSDNSAFPGVNNSCIKDERVGEADSVMQDVNICEGKSSKDPLEMLAKVQKEVPNAETSGSDLSSSRGKNLIGQVGNGEISKKNEHCCNGNIRGSRDEDERIESLNCEEKRKRKRKRPIMNDTQASLFESAVQQEPDIHKNAVSLHSWAVRLSSHGSEVTPSQLKNWLNNRKAKLSRRAARRAAKDGRLSSVDTPTTDQQNDSTARPSFLPECLTEDGSAHAKGQNHFSITEKPFLGANLSKSIENAHQECSTQLNPQNCQVANSNCARLVVGQAVILTDGQGKIEKPFLGANLSPSIENVRPECSTQSNPQNCQVANSTSNCVRLAVGQAVVLTDGLGKTEKPFLGANLSQSIENVHPECSTQSNPQNCQVTNCVRLAVGQGVVLTDGLGKTEKPFLGANLNPSIENVHPECSTQLDPQNCEVVDSNTNSNCVRCAVGQAVVLADGLGNTEKPFLGANLSQSIENVHPECSTQLDPQNCQVANSNCARFATGQAVVLTDCQGKEMANGTVIQVEGIWEGFNLADTNACVVDITELKSDRIVMSPLPSVEGGATFEKAEVKVGNMRVLWDFCRIRVR